MTKIERLVDYFIPETYHLELTLERLARHFNGRVVIAGKRASLISPIKLHAKELDITGVLINDIPATVTFGDNDEITLIPSANPISRKVTLTLGFNGKITDAMNGLYPCYFEHDGQKKELLATHLESHHAREIFPSIDEPAAKATFDLTINTENKVKVLSNMPVKNQHTRDDRLITTFNTSPRMSTYLLAFVVGDLHKTSTTTADGVEVNVWATRSQPKANLAFALDTATRAIEFFNNFFSTKYPLPKADHVAIPDFSGGVAAMENWGLITYREDYLVVDPKATAVSTKQHAATSIVHETSHQWFGNLVTMQWWDDLWLNESFATLMEYISLDNLFPEWNVWLNFAGQDRLPALRRDSISGVQAIKSDVAHPDQINTLFDGAIVYAKGGCVLYMLRSYIGEAAFKKGLKHYFKLYAYGNTTGADLWQAFANASGKDTVSFISPWLEQSGFPVVSVTCKDKQLTISQQQFLIGKKTNGKKQWVIPLFSNTATLPDLLDNTKITTTYDGVSSLKLNMGDQAHFVTKYSPELFTRLIQDVKAGKLQPVDRLQLLHEATLLPKGGLSRSADVIELLQAYQNETSQPIWDIISLAIGDLRRFVENDTQAEAGLKRLSIKLAQKLYHKLGWHAGKNETEATTKLRATVIGLMLYGEDPDTIQTALKQYHHVNDISEINGELRSLVLSAAVKYSNDPNVIDDLLSYHATTYSSDLRHDISQSLTTTKDKLVAKRLLKLFTDSQMIRPQDVTHWFIFMLKNRYSRELTWSWLTQNWSWINQTFAGGTTYDAFPQYSAGCFNQPNGLSRYKVFFEPLKKDLALTRAIEVGINEMEGRLKWLKRDRADVIKKLRNI